MPEDAQKDEIQVKVSFPISKHGPYQHDFTRETTLGTALGLAMEHFEAQDDSQFEYLLAHDGQEQNPTTLLGSVAGHAKAVHFTLVKKITQG